MSIEVWREERRRMNEGKTFGNIEVLKFSHSKRGRLYYVCKCGLCGREFTTRVDGVKNGHTQSCGCAFVKWSYSNHGMKGLTKDRAYWVWAKVKSRCYNQNCREYKNYGGRGIKMCDEWLDAETFIKWCYATGYDNTAPKGQCTLDRIDCDGDYEPSNCRWITNLKQQNNRRDNRRFTYNGETHTVAEWARMLNIPYPTLNAGLVREGRTIEYYLNDYVPHKRRTKS